MFVPGEPGIGKSRLTRELAGRARAAGATVITGRAVPAGQSMPYRPLTEALRGAPRGERATAAEGPPNQARPVQSTLAELPGFLRF